MLDLLSLGLAMSAVDVVRFTLAFMLVWAAWAALGLWVGAVKRWCAGCWRCVWLRSMAAGGYVGLVGRLALVA